MRSVRGFGLFLVALGGCAMMDPDCPKGERLTLAQDEELAGTCESSERSYTRTNTDDTKKASSEKVPVQSDEESSGKSETGPTPDAGGPPAGGSVTVNPIDPTPPTPSTLSNKVASCGTTAGSSGTATDPATQICYVAWANKLTWDAAKSACASRGGKLVTFGSAQEEAVVKPLFKNDLHWIGLSRAQKGGTFQWVDGTAITYAHWAADEPGTDDQLCVDFDPDDVVGWHDRDCDFTRYYVCEHAPVTR